MKRISILMAIILWATIGHCWTSKTEYHTASGDVSYIYPDSETGNIMIQNPDDTEGYYPLRTPDLNVTVQAHSNALDDLSALTSPVAANVLTFLGAADYDAMSALLSIKKAEQSATLDNGGTLTLDQADELRAYLTCTASQTNITVVKSGNEVTGNIAYLIVAGTNQAIFDDQPGTLELDGRTVLDQGKVMPIIFITDRWYQLGRPSGANLYVDDINLYDSVAGTYGTIQGSHSCIVASGDLTLTADQINGDIIITGTGTATIPYEFSVASGGTSLTHLSFLKLTTAPYYIQSADGLTEIIREDGVGIGAGDRIGTGTTYNSEIELISFEEHKIRVKSGTTTDEGVGLTCALLDQYSATSTSEIGIGVYNVNRSFIGTVITTPSGGMTPCQIDVYSQAITNSIAGIDYYCRIYAYNAGAFGALVATSDELDGSDILSGRTESFVFSTPPTLTSGAQYCYAFYGVTDGAGPSATPYVDTTSPYNIWGIRYTDESNVGVLNGGIVTGWKYYWNASGASPIIDTGDDINLWIHAQ